jgi:eukaryotic-like serine/threonine-protein kinase
MSNRYRFGPFELDAAEHILRAGGRPVALTRRAFDTLLYLVRNPGRLVTREELLGAVWSDAVVEEGNLHWTISAVRKALAQQSAEPWIETARGLGYRFIGAVEAVEEEAEAPETPADPVEIPPPTRPARRRILTAVGFAAALIALLAWTVSNRRETGRVVPGAGIAVVGFHNLSPRGDDGWIGTALAELLAADLGRGGSLRLIPSEDVAGMRRDLGFRMDGPLGREELAQVRRHLGSDWVIVGSFLRLEGQDPPLRVDVRVRNAETGETHSTISRRGRETELFALADALAADLRRALGQPADGVSGDERAVMPAAPRTQRLYADGLERLRRRDARAAAERLEKAVEADPGFPSAWLALAQAYELLGSTRQAEDAALKAVERSAGLPERRRLAAEAIWLRIARRAPEAAVRLRRVYELSHTLEDGLALAETQAKAGKAEDALATLEELKRRHPDQSGDARLAILEAEAFGPIEDFQRQKVSAERALEAARRQGITQIEVRALHFLAVARVRSGTIAECPRAFEEIAMARRKAEATGDRFLQASVLVGLGTLSSECSDASRGEAAYREAIHLFREAGALGKLPVLLYNLGGIRLDEGDLLGADRLMREALEICQAHGILCRERFLHPLGVNRMHRGELMEARRMIEEGMRLNRELGNQRRAAEAQGFLPDIAAWSGDLEEAITLLRQGLELRRESGDPEGLAWAHLDLANRLSEAGRGSEALEQARKAVELAGQNPTPTLDACSRASLAQAHLAVGDLAAADRESARAIALLRPPRHPISSFAVWRVRVKALLERGQLDTAEALLADGLDLARRNGFVYYELSGRLFQAELALARGRKEEARRLAADLGAEARAKGFGLIAKGCEAVRRRAR